MLTLRKGQVPDYLQNSDFYQNLCDDDEQQFDLSTKHFKDKGSVHSYADLDHLLSTLRFWGTNEYPTDLLDFIWNSSAVENQLILSEYWDELTYLKGVMSVLSAKRQQQMNVAAQYGDVKLVKYLFERACECDWTVCKTAASSGQLPCLQYLLSRLVISDNEAYQQIIHAALETGQLGCLSYLASNTKFDVDWPRCLAVAALSGTLTCVEFVFHKCNDRWCDYADFYLTRSGSVDCLRFAVDHGLTYDYSVMWEAVERGLLPIVMYLHTQGLELFPNLLNKAAACGQVEVMHYVYTNVACDLRTSLGAAAAAAGNGHLNCLVYAHINFPVSWDASATRAAAAGNKLGCLKYLHNHGCPWNHKTTDAAIRHNSMECLTYAVENGCSVRWKHKLRQFWKKMKGSTSTTFLPL